MSELFGLFFSTALVNNLVLTHLVGLDLQVAASRRMKAAWLIGLATTYCLTLILPGVYLLDVLIILPLQLQHLDLLFYVLLIIVIILASQKMMHRLFPLLYQHIDALVPILLINSLMLAVILLKQEAFNITLAKTFVGSLAYGFSSGIGFLFLVLVITCLRERIDNDNIPEPFRGLPILLIALGIFSMGLMGLAGLQ